MAFERSCDGSPRLLVVVNIDPTYPQDFEFDGAQKLDWKSGDKILDVITMKEYGLDGTKLKLKMDKWGYGVFVKKVEFDLKPAITQVEPVHDSVVRLDKEPFKLELTFSKKMDPNTIQVSVKPAVNVGGVDVKPLVAKTKGGSDGKTFGFELATGDKLSP